MRDREGKTSEAREPPAGTRLKACRRPAAEASIGNNSNFGILICFLFYSQETMENIGNIGNIGNNSL